MTRNATLTAAAVISAALALGGCANDGALYRADTYTAGQVNRVQEVNTVEIIGIAPARVAVSNQSNRQTAQIAGAVLGAIAGAAIGSHNNHSGHARALGGVAGGAVGALAGDAIAGPDTTYTDGVQITFKNAGGRVLQTAQVGRPCEFKYGTAVMVSPTPAEARIQPNNPYGCGTAQ
ncbi:glycine zipper 2TM domain-containing protein [Sutterella sp.]|uniref:glycine zipper 2TM domain-containing protein n=1 Tax=Sutterella sp. TaxID=1981025 RepID=UPI0026E0007B|nr:glycine zipper 2TM domain-containing protein [Sutterella sp.]MDO5531139.1 glycine zipper 2TM domain-containing protein [Sutterella sp.]